MRADEEEKGGNARKKEDETEGKRGSVMGGNFSKGVRFPAHAPQCVSPRAPSAKISEARVPSEKPRA